MKLFVTIPAFNEEKTLVKVIKSIPKKYKGISQVKILVYDDGSVDKTASVAKQSGADYIFSHKHNLGLAQTFKDAIKESLRLGADIIVNTDADNQYEQKEIVKLIQPIIEGKADLVIGDRQVSKLDHMSWSKKYGNLLGSFAIRWLTGTKIQDASSGFRAFTKDVASNILIFSTHTYTHEMIISAHFRSFTLHDVPIIFKKRVTGGSRLISNGIFSHILKSGTTILRSLLLYKAMAVFTTIGSFIILGGFIGILRFFYLALVTGKAGGHIQSLVISSVLIGIGFNILIIGFIADMISYNRKLIEEKITHQV